MNISMIFACNFSLGWQICSLKKVQSALISAGSASADLTNYRSKMFKEKNFQKVSKAELEFVACWQLQAYLGGIEDLVPEHCNKVSHTNFFGFPVHIEIMFTLL